MSDEVLIFFKKRDVLIEETKTNSQQTFRIKLNKSKPIIPSETPLNLDGSK